MARQKKPINTELTTLLKKLPVKEVQKITGNKVGMLRTYKSRNAITKDKWRWSKTEDRFVLSEYNKTLSASEIGARIERSKWAVVNRYRLLVGKREK